MKNLFLIFAMGAIIQASAQSLKDSEVPDEVSQNFKEEYSNAQETQWEKEGDVYSVTFSVANEQEVNIVYDESGKVKEKYMAIPQKDVPASILNHLKSNYEGHNVKNYWVKQRGSQRIYKVELEDQNAGLGTITGSANGTLNSQGSGLSSVSRKDSTASVLSNRTEGDALMLYFDKEGNQLSLENALLSLQDSSKSEQDKETIKKEEKVYGNEETEKNTKEKDK